MCSKLVVKTDKSSWELIVKSCRSCDGGCDACRQPKRLARGDLSLVWSGVFWMLQIINVILLVNVLSLECAQQYLWDALLNQPHDMSRSGLISSQIQLISFPSLSLTKVNPQERIHGILSSYLRAVAMVSQLGIWFFWEWNYEP